MLVIAFVGVFALVMKEHLLSKILPMLVSLSVGTLMGSAFIHLLSEAVKRAEKMLGGFCGSHGICGAAVRHWHFYQPDCRCNATF